MCLYNVIKFAGIFLLICGFMAMNMSRKFGEFAEKVDALQLVFSGTLASGALEFQQVSYHVKESIW